MTANPETIPQKLHPRNYTKAPKSLVTSNVDTYTTFSCNQGNVVRLPLLPEVIPQIIDDSLAPHLIST